MKGPKWAWFIVNSVFGIVLEEIDMAIKSYRPAAKFFNLQSRNENAEFDDLTEDEKIIVTEFFDRKDRRWFYVEDDPSRIVSPTHFLPDFVAFQSL